MKQYQRGEAIMAVVMIVMMAAVWMASGHMSMMGQDANHADHSASTEQKPQAAVPTQPAAETQH